MNESFVNCTCRLVLFPFCLFFSVFGQVRAQQDDFNARYNEIYVHVSASNGPKALRMADSLLSASKNDEQRVKSHMLLANVHHSLGNHAQEFSEALQAQKIAKAASNPGWQASISGFLSTAFRHMGLMQESKKHLTLAEDANEKQRGTPNYLLTKINIEHEKAFHAMEEDDYHEALQYLNNAKVNIHYEENEDPKTLLIKATNDQLFGVCYLALDELNLADSLFQSALSRINGQENNLKPYIYRGQAEVAMSRGWGDSALFYLHLVEPYLESSDREELKLLFYESNIRYHKMFGNSAEVIRYQDLYTSLKATKEHTAKKVTDELVGKLAEENQKYEENLFFSGMIFLVLVSVLSVLLLYLFRKRKDEKQRYADLIDHLNRDKIDVTALATFQEDNKDVMISKETEESLLKKLEELEEEAFFLDKNVSLTKLANSFGTNQRYVSYIIRKHRGKDFNDYLHHARIHYLINQIRLDKNLLDYKLSYLADMAGFSSHSKFSSVFKAITGLPPSVFIHFTKDEMSKSEQEKRHSLL